MSALTDHLDSVFSLAELVEVANSLLPGYLPKDASGRAVDEVNVRLVRHHATQGLLPEALKDGREARYVFEHLVSLLLVRKLLAEGFGSSAIKQIVDGRETAELQALLEGSLRLDLTPKPSAALDPARQEFLQRVRAKAGLETGATAPAPQPATTIEDLFEETTWSRITLLDGLDLFVRDDFVLPTNRLGDEQLTQLLKVVLLQLEQRRKAR